MGLRFTHETGAAAPVTPSTPTFNWTKQQQAIFDWFANGIGNLVVIARAGTGKTTTICEAVTRAPEQNIFVTSFGNRIVKELDARVGQEPAVLVKSVHGVGLQAISRLWSKGKRITVDVRDRGRQLTDAVCPPKLTSSARYTIQSLMTYAREHRPYMTTEQEMLAMAKAYGIEHDSIDQATMAHFAYKCFLHARQPSMLIDYADMIYLPLVVPGMAQPRFDLIVGDEAQDFNRPQLDLMQMLLNPGGRFCVVGDDKQAIYAFRGADVGALARIQSALKADTLTLTQTYRCGVEIVKHAQLLVPDIHVGPDAHKGEVREMNSTDLLRALAPGDWVLSRTNAPLAKIAMRLLRENRRVIIQGRDIGKTLADVVNKLSKWGDIADMFVFTDKLEAWTQAEIAKARKDENDAREQFVMDQYETLTVLAEGVNSPKALIARIYSLFNEVDGDGNDVQFIVCSTVHKAKGLEADRVFILSSTFFMRVTCTCGHRHREDRPCGSCTCVEYNADPLAIQEERNIKYVAITRAKQQLTYVLGAL